MLNSWFYLQMPATTKKKNHCRWMKYLILNKTLNELAYVNWTFEFDFKVIFRIKTHS